MHLLFRIKNTPYNEENSVDYKEMVYMLESLFGVSKKRYDELRKDLTDSKEMMKTKDNIIKELVEIIAKKEKEA